jgi:hypothetical protein
MPIGPVFGGRPHRTSLALNEAGQHVVEHIRCIIANDFPQIEHCPFIPAISAILAHYMKTPNDLLGAMDTIIQCSLTRDPRKVMSFYLPQNQHELVGLGPAFGKLLKMEHPKLFQVIGDISADDNDPFWQDYITNFLIGLIPQAFVWRIFDVYMVEGYIAVLKFTLALFKQQKPFLLECDTPEQVHKALESHILSEIEIDVLAKAAQKYDIQYVKVKKMLTTDALDPNQSRLSTRVQRHSPKKLQDSGILADLHWIILWTWIPTKYRTMEIVLNYTTAEHGYRLATMIQMSRGAGPLLLVIKTIQRSIFGAFIPGGWPSEGDYGTFVGTGTLLK